jgi:hypothetical protein
MQAELEPLDGELLALAELTDQVARSLDEALIRHRLLAMADEVRAMAYGRPEFTSRD